MFRGGLPDDFDHLLVAVDRLDASMAWFAERLGVRPVEGGKHASWGTHNALLSLGPKRYLEIIALDADADPAARASGEAVFCFSAGALPRVMGWCAGSRNLAERASRAAQAGVDIGQPIQGGRDCPDGTRIAWTITPPRFLGDGLIPFFIDWGETAHPSAAAPTGCRLARLEGEHPDPERIWRMLASVGSRLSVSRGPRARLIATIEGPAGSITLSDAPSVARRS